MTDTAGTTRFENDVAEELGIQTLQDKTPEKKSHLAVVQQEEDWGCAPQSEESHPLDDTQINQAIKHFQQNLDEWNFYGTSFSELITKFHDWSVELWSHFIPSYWKDKPISKPEFLFKFERAGRRVLGHYHRGRNDTGLKYEISINPGWLVARSEAQTAAVVLHELMHAFEEIVGISSKSRNNYHKKWFCDHAEEIGIPCSKFGAEAGIVKGSPFAEWTIHRGLNKSKPLVTIDAENAREACKVKRTYWFCDCAPRPVRVHVARGTLLNATCNNCGKRFRRKVSDED